MPCLGPLTAYKPKFGSESKRLVFDKRLSETGIPVSVPCGQCVECRLDNARQWGIRIMKEAQCHEASSFLTLTYDDANLPDGGTLVKDDIQAFHKRLHNRLLRSRGYGIRFYYSGEYGETYGRPHYHSIVFGFEFPDKQFYKYNKRGEPIYQSEYLRDLWPVGRNGIGLVTFDSAMYVAGYVVDKVNGKLEKEGHYVRVDSDGRVYSVLPEFAGMSRRPGIGRPWFDKFKDETYRDDFVVVNGARARPPRYFDNLFEDVDSARLARLKVIRRRGVEELSSRRSYAREKIVKARLALRKKDVS